METEPTLYDFTAVDGIRHTVWKVKEQEALIAEFAKVPTTYVADGHHRSASASRARAECAKCNPNHKGTEDYNRFLSVLFPSNQLKILPYNRVVYDLAGHSVQEFLDKVGEVLIRTNTKSATPAARGEFSIYVDGSWHGFKAKEEHLSQADPVARLDAAILQDLVLNPILDIEDPRVSDRIGFVGGIRGVKELEARVNKLPGSVAFSLFPLGLDQLMDVADQNRVLPPKSTWFEPKLRSGLLIHTF
jgi:uncharacterized protein (DUF1015 family)